MEKSRQDVVLNGEKLGFRRTKRYKCHQVVVRNKKKVQISRMKTEKSY